MKLHDTRLEWRQCLHTSGKLVFAFSQNGSKETIYSISIDPISKRGTAISIQYFSVTLTVNECAVADPAAG